MSTTITTDAERLLGVLEIEFAVASEPEGVGSRDRVDYRPRNVPMLNDGVTHYWMHPGESYRLTRDGHGWVISCRTWSAAAAGHTYRLADAATLAFVDRLPLAAGGDVALDQEHAYELRFTEPGIWSVYAVA